MPDLAQLFLSVPHWAVYLIIGGIVFLESMGIPLPGETALIAAAILSAHHEASVTPLGVALAGATGAIVGDSVGYAIGRRFGRHLLALLRRRFPKHFGAEQVAYAEHVFHVYGMSAVFFGRFIALLRIFAGPLSGILRMHYPRFLAANAAGGIAWAFVMTFSVYYLGVVAEHWLKNIAWLGLAAFVAVAVGISLLMKQRVDAAVQAYARANPDKVAAVAALD